MQSEWLHPRGTLAEGPWQTVVGQGEGCSHTGLRVAEIVAGMRLELPAGDIERVVVPLSGRFRVEYREPGAGTAASVPLAGRASVFDGPTDVLYLGSASSAVVTGSGRLAVAEAPATRRTPAQHLSAADVPVEIRGGGQASRQVHNFGIPGVLDAEKLIVCEVITPAGNWSSYPPHKHDESDPGVESRLEEIYYFESAVSGPRAPQPDADPFGLFATYSSPAGEIDINAIVRSGDVALVPYGYHGPAVAAPGYDLYYLNVMAGPDAAREWLITDDPHHRWVRTTWPDQGLDPRLPFRGPQEGR